jgi:hypothetical protein
MLESRRLALSRFHAVEQETTEIWEPVEASVSCCAQTSQKRDFAQCISLGGKSRCPSLRFLRFRLFPNEYLRLSRAARTFLSVAATTGCLLLLYPSPARAQGGVPLWTNRYNGSGNSEDTPSAIAVDSSGNVFVTGDSYALNGSRDYATVAYSNSGVPLWTNRYTPENGWDVARALALDGSGNVFVTGVSYESGGLSLDFATIKYSSAGVPVWTNRYDGPGNREDYAFAIVPDSSGNVFVTGRSIGTFGTFNFDYVTVAYSSAGVPLWTNRYDGPGNSSDEAKAIALDNIGNVFVTGGSEFLNGSGNQSATVAYSSAGVPLWTNLFGGGALAVDSSGNLLVTGTMAAVDVFTIFDYVTIKCSGAGVPLWTNRYNGPANGGDQPIAIAVDSSANVFVTGSSSPLVGDGYDYATVAYSSAGVPLWTNRYNGPANGEDSASAIAVDANGNVFVTGYSGGGISTDYATIAYSSTGVPLWTNRYNGPANGGDSASAIAVDANGNVFVTGSSWNGTNRDYVTIKYSSSVPPPVHLDFQKLSNQLVLSWTNAGFNLQSAPAVTGTFTNLLGVTSRYTNPLSGGQQFFRLIGN